MSAKPTARAETATPASSASAPARVTSNKKKKRRRRRDGPRKLAAALAEREWSQRTLASKMNVSPPTVTRWLNGERLPSRAHMRTLEVLLDIPVGAWV